MSLSLPSIRIGLPLFVLAASLGAADGGTGLAKKSPFELRGGPAAPPPAVSETIEFAGVSSIGKKTDLIFYDKTAKKSHWIAQGETKEGIAVINYDSRREEAVVKINGVQKTLALRKPAGPVASARPSTMPTGGFNTLPAPAGATVATPLPAVNPVNAVEAASTAPNAAPQVASPTPAPAPGSPAEVQARQETEARMLVSDLLEIGMAQRRAYEEAQRKAAGGGGQAQGTPANPPGTPPQSEPPAP